MNIFQKVAHHLGWIGVVTGILTSPIVTGILPAKLAALIAAVSYALKSLTAPGALFDPSTTGTAKP